VTYKELTNDEGAEPVIKTGTLDSLIARKRIGRVHRGGGEGSNALIAYDTLPDKYKSRYVAKYGDPIEQLKKNLMKSSSLKIDDEARAYYHEKFEYCLNGGQRHLDKGLADEYTANASVLNVLIDELANKTGLRRSSGNSTRNVWGIIQDICENMRYREEDKDKENPVHTLPKNLSRLKGTIREYKREGYPSLISGKVGNRNTLKITEEAGRYLIAMKRCRKPVYNDSQLFDKFNEEAPARGWKPLKSIRSMVTWLNSEAIQPMWYDAVHGELAAKQRYGRKHHTHMPGLRDSLWYGDGTKLNLYYKDQVTDKDGHTKTVMRTTMVYEVMDAYSEVLLGYHISDTENFIAQYNAFRMAMQVSKHRPYEIVTDNQGGAKTNKLKDLLGKVSAHVFRPTAPNTPQAKSIENAFGRFQQEVLHKDFRFTGGNITDRKRNSRPNLEFIAANVDSLYTLAELKEAYAAARKDWNEARHPKSTLSRMEMYGKSVNDGTPEVTAGDMADIFWLRTDKPVQYTDYGIKIQVRGQEYSYEAQSKPGELNKAWISKHMYGKFYVKYDPYDMTSVKLYSESEAFECVAMPPIYIHRGIQEQTEGEAKFIRQQQQELADERIERHAAAKEIEYEHGVAPEQQGLNTPKLAGLTKEQEGELERQVQRRVKKYTRDPQMFELGPILKEMTNVTYDEVEDGDYHIGGEGNRFDLKKAAGKI
jgi:hypothetical protein